MHVFKGFALFNLLSYINSPSLGLTPVLDKIANNLSYGGGSSNGNNKDHFFKLILKVLISIEFILVYFFVYTPFGLSIFCISYYSLFSGLVDVSEFWAYVCLLIFSLAVSSVFNVYVLAQFKNTREFLIECIGFDAYAQYVGTNPGSDLLKRFGATFAGVSLATSLSQFSDYFIGKWRGEIYESACKRNDVPFEPRIYASMVKTEKGLSGAISKINPWDKS